MIVILKIVGLIALYTAGIFTPKLLRLLADWYIDKTSDTTTATTVATTTTETATTTN